MRLACLALCLLAFGTPPRIAAGQSFPIDESVEGSWLDPNTPGQGFLMDYFPGVNKLFVAWFTFDPKAVSGNPNALRWMTATLDVTFDHASGDVFTTTGGAFNAALPVPVDTSIGSMSIHFAGCDQASLDFDLKPPDDVSGTISIVSLGSVVDPVVACQPTMDPLNHIKAFAKP